jgi:hypothetical protein
MPQRCSPTRLPRSAPELADPHAARARTPAEFASEAANPSVTKVTDWTYPAYFETNNNFLHALRGNTELLISVVDETTDTSNAEILTKEKALATEAFTKV